MDSALTPTVNGTDEGMDHCRRPGTISGGGGGGGFVGDQLGCATDTYPTNVA